MNKLITTDTGGFPYVLDDIRWEQDAYREALNDIVKGIVNNGTTDFVLWGCNITDNTTYFDVSEGAIVFDGEIYHLAATTNLTKVALQYLIFKPSTGTYDSDGLKTFQDAATHDTYELRFATATISAIPGAGSYIIASTAGTAAIPEKYDYQFANKVTETTKITLGSTNIDDCGSFYSTNNIVADSSGVKFWKTGSTVNIRGGFSQNPATSVTTRYKVGSLPSGYRPPSSCMVNGFATNNAGAEWCIFEIESGGDIYIRGDLFNLINGTGITFHATIGIVINGTFCI